MPRIESFDGTELYYEDIGEGRPVVMAHGWAFSHDLFENQITSLCDTYRLIALDLRGHGKSDNPASDYQFSTYSKDVSHLINKLGLYDVTLIGWSIGGGIATHYAGTGSDRLSQLGLITPASPKVVRDDEYPYGLPEDELVGLLEMEKSDRAECRTTAVEMAYHQEISDAKHEWMVDMSMQTPQWVGVASLEALITEDQTEAAKNIDVPTKIFQGEEDAYRSVEGAKYLGDLIDDSELVTYEGVGHTPHQEIPDQFNNDLETFLDQV